MSKQSDSTKPAVENLTKWLAAAACEDDIPPSALRRRLDDFADRHGDDPDSTKKFHRFMTRLASTDPDKCFTIAEAGARRLDKQAAISGSVAALPLRQVFVRSMLKAAETKAQDWTRLEEAFDDLPVVLGYADSETLRRRAIGASLRMAAPVMFADPEMYEDLLAGFAKELARAGRRDIRRHEAAVESATEAGDRLRETLAARWTATEGRELDRAIGSLSP